MQRVITYFSLMLIGVAVSGPASAADGTRLQHRNWMQKLETPGGTFSETIESLTQPTDSHLASPGTAIQHRSWIRKREILDNSQPLPL